MFVVTWKFEGAKHSQKFASSAGADRRAEWLRRQGDCSSVKVKPIGTALDWSGVDAQQQEKVEAVSKSDASDLAQELWTEGKNKSEIVAALNAKFDPTFFKTMGGIYQVAEPDYLPEIPIMVCHGRDY